MGTLTVTDIEYNASKKDSMTTEAYLRNWCKQMYYDFVVRGVACTHRGQSKRNCAGGGTVTHSCLPYEFVTKSGKRYELRVGGRVICKGKLSDLCYKELYAELVYH